MDSHFVPSQKLNTSGRFMARADGGLYGTSYGLERSFTTIPIPLPNVVVQSAYLSAARVAPGDPVQVTATVANRDTVNGNTAVKLYVNGQEAAVQGVTVESGKARSITFTTAQSQPGTYTVYVGGVQAGSFTVNEYVDPDIVLFISMALIVCSLALGIVYVLRRRQQEY